jgi:chromosome partitioning protein
MYQAFYVWLLTYVAMVVYYSVCSHNNTEVHMGALVAVVNPKGGAGKTTVATNLASRTAKDAGNDAVKLIDADAHQHSADDWLAARSEMASITVPVVARGLLSGKIYDDLRRERARWNTVIVDCPGSDSPETRGAMGAADMIVVPVGVGQTDIGALGQMAQLIMQIREGGNRTPILAVLNNVDSRCTREAKEVMDLLRTMGDYFKTHDTVLWDRQAVRSAMRAGMGVHELTGTSHDPKATAEFETLYQEVLDAIVA